MRLSSPRVAPLSDAELTPDQEEALKPVRNGTMGVLNIFRTLAHAPKALTRFNDWGGYVLSRRNDLPAREREIVILRVGFLCKSGYEFTQHTRIGLQSGLTDAEIENIKRGADAGWSAADAALIRAADGGGRVAARAGHRAGRRPGRRPGVGGGQDRHPRPQREASGGAGHARLWFFSGRVRMRLPVAAKMAFSTAGAATAMVGSPTPPQKPPDGMTMVSTSGISAMRITS